MGIGLYRTLVGQIKMIFQEACLKGVLPIRKSQ